MDGLTDCLRVRRAKNAAGTTWHPGAARRRGIAVTNSPDANAPAVADSAMMLLMAATRHLREADRHVHAGDWQDQWRVDTPTISRKRLGILDRHRDIGPDMFA